MHTTKKERATTAPKSSRIIESSLGEDVTERIEQLGELAARIHGSIASLAKSAAVRLLLVELERYERTVLRWATFPPTEAQCDALADELAGLESRVQQLVESAPRRKTPPSRARATTTKLPRVT